jgi:hypothetical protein
MLRPIIYSSSDTVVESFFPIPQLRSATPMRTALNRLLLKPNIPREVSQMCAGIRDPERSTHHTQGVQAAGHQHCTRRHIFTAAAITSGGGRRRLPRDARRAPRRAELHRPSISIGTLTARHCTTPRAAYDITRLCAPSGPPRSYPHVFHGCESPHGAPRRKLRTHAPSTQCPTTSSD